MARLVAGLRNRADTRVPLAGLQPTEVIRNLVEPKVSRPSLLVRLRRNIRPDPTEMAASFRGLSFLLQSGVPIVRALMLIAEGSGARWMYRVFYHAAISVEKGARLSDAFRPFAEGVSPLLIPLLEAGEESGRLDAMLARFADAMEREAKLRMKVRSMVTYPLFLFAVSLAVLIFLPTFLLHGIFEFMQDLKVEVPWSTRLLMGISNGMRSPLTGFVALLAGVLVGLGWRHLMKSPEARRRRDASLLRAWLVGPVLRQVSVASYALTLEALYSAAVPVLKALTIAARATGNLEMETRLAPVGERVLHGRMLYEALQETGQFPNLAIHFIAAGEETGTLPASLASVASTAEEAVTYRLNVALAALEPLMLWLMGCLVGLICLATLQPFIRIIETFDR
jgi:type II secretory pathway component PulF